MKIRYELHQNLKYDRCARPETLTIGLNGACGIGKSLLMKPLCLELIARTAAKEDLSRLKDDFYSFIYCRQWEHKYWEGYNGQFAVFYDDLGQFKGGEDDPDGEVQSIIRNANIFENGMHMAFEGKGVIKFTSQMILFTTNLKHLEFKNHLNEPRAFERRVHFFYELRPKKEFLDPDFNSKQRNGGWDYGLDFKKVKKDSPIDVDMYEFVNNRDRSEVLSYSELMDKMVDSYFKKAKSVESQRTDLDSAMNRGLAKRVEELGLTKPQGLGYSSVERIEMQSESDLDLDELEAEMFPEKMTKVFDSYLDLEIPSRKISIWSSALMKRL